MLPSRILPAAPDLISVPVQIPVAGFPPHLARHRRRARDAGLRHVAGLLAGMLG